MPKGNSREPLNRWFVLLLAVCSSMVVGIWIGWALGKSAGGAGGVNQVDPLSTQYPKTRQTEIKVMESSDVAETKSTEKHKAGMAKFAAYNPPRAKAATPEQATLEAAQPMCDLSSNLNHLQDNEKFDYPRQLIAGPMQADEMLVLFAMVRTSFVRRVLEIGGYKGDSAYNWLEALRCKLDATVYTVDLNIVPQHEHPAVRHKAILKDAATLVLEDIDNEPIDLLLLDCHAYEASKHIFNAVIGNNLLSRNGFIVLHDTGMHPTKFQWPSWPGPMIRHQDGVIHQPVERLLADWIPLQDCSFQRLSFHHDDRYAPRHGLTILQRRTDFDFNKECQLHAKGRIAGAFSDFYPKDCDEIRNYTTKVQNQCPTV